MRPLQFEGQVRQAVDEPGEVDPDVNRGRGLATPCRLGGGSAFVLGMANQRGPLFAARSPAHETGTPPACRAGSTARPVAGKSSSAVAARGWGEGLKASRRAGAASRRPLPTPPDAASGRSCPQSPARNRPCIGVGPVRRASRSRPLADSPVRGPLLGAELLIAL